MLTVWMFILYVLYILISPTSSIAHDNIDMFKVLYVPFATHCSSSSTIKNFEEQAIGSFDMPSQRLNELFLAIQTNQIRAIEKEAQANISFKIIHRRSNKAVYISSTKQIFSQGKLLQVDEDFSDAIVESILQYFSLATCTASHFTIFYIPIDRVVGFYTLTTPGNIENRAFCSFEISSCHFDKLFKEIKTPKREPINKKRYNALRIKISNNETNEVVYISKNEEVFSEGKQFFVGKQLMSDIIDTVIRVTDCIKCELKVPEIEGTPIPFEAE